MTMEWDKKFRKSLAKGESQEIARWKADGEPLCPHCSSQLPWRWHREERRRLQDESDVKEFGEVISP